MSGIIKYKETLYNESVIDTTTNTVVFPHSPKWKEYEDWKEKNQKQFFLLKQEKTRINLHNGGLPHIKENGEVMYDEDGQLLWSKTNVDGGYRYKEFHINGDLKIESQYNNLVYGLGEDELVYEKEYNPDEETPFRTVTVDEFGTKIESIYHHKDVLKKRMITIPALGNKVTSHFTEEGILYKKIQLTKKMKRTSTYFIEDGKLESEVEKDLNTKISTLTEYYPSGKIRTKGKLDKDGKLDGRWVWYAMHGSNSQQSDYGQLEAIHNFINGKLSGTSQLFMEDGGLFFQTEID
jgi:antitoxin component YwqK of YwqJK toxin-antitoxin module